MMAEQDEHSIKRHPLKELLTPSEWEKLRDDVQYCRVSWPISIQRDQDAES